MILVHGLSDSWQETWDSPESLCAWLQDILLQEIPKAQVWTAGFEARKKIQDGLAVFEASSDKLLKDFEEGISMTDRQVLFVVHSLGGIIPQRALQSCPSSLQSHISGVVFFGCPNFGTDQNKWYTFNNTLDQISNSTLSATLPNRQSPSQSDPINDRFSTWLPGQMFAKCIDCFYETQPLNEISIIVEKHFPAIGASDATGLSADHLSIAKFPMKSESEVVTSSLTTLSYNFPSPTWHSKIRYTFGHEERLLATLDGPKELTKLALMLEDQGYYKEAYNRISQATRLFETHFGFGHQLTLFCHEKQLSLLCSSGQYEAAARLSKKLMGEQMNSPDRRLNYGNLALAMIYQNDYQGVFELVRDVLESEGWCSLERSSQVTLSSTLTKAMMEWQMNDLAEFLACDVVRASMSLYGKGDSLVFNYISDLATVLASKNHITSAEAIERYALEGLEEALGTFHPYALQASKRHADLLYLQGRYSDASKQLKRILKAQEKCLGTNHPDTLSTMSSLGVVHISQGYKMSAETILVDAYNRQEQTLGPKHSSTMQTRHALKSLEIQQELLGSHGKGLMDHSTPETRLDSQDKSNEEKHGGSLFLTPDEGRVIAAAKEGDISKLEASICQNKINSHIAGRALREAAANGQYRALELLLTEDAPIDALGGLYGTPLNAASFSGHDSIVKYLLDRKANVNIEGGIFKNAILAATINQHAEVVRLLLEYPHGSPIKAGILNSSLQVAIATERVDIVVQLLEAGANINVKDELFGSPLQQASLFNQTDIMEQLLSQPNSQVNLQGGIFGSPLKAAIQASSKSAIGLLLQHKVDLCPLYCWGNNSYSQDSDSENSNCEDEKRVAAEYEETLAKSLIEQPENFRTALLDQTHDADEMIIRRSSTTNKPRSYIPSSVENILYSRKEVSPLPSILSKPPIFPHAHRMISAV